VGRFVTDWAGPEPYIRGLAIKHGTPNEVGDVMKLRGRVVSVDAEQGLLEVEVVGKNAWGNHVEGKVRLALPKGA
jgi:hypothetical protein